MGACVGSMAGACCAQCLANVFSCGMTVDKKYAKLLFAIVQLWSFVWMIVFRSFSVKWFGDGMPGFTFGINECRAVDVMPKPEFEGTPKWEYDGRVFSSREEMLGDLRTECFQAQATMRWSFATAFSFLVLMVLAICGMPSRVLYQYWGFKFLAPGGFAFIAFLMPSGFFQGFAGVFSTLVAFFFFLIQFLLLLDMGYSWNNVWIENALEDQRANLQATGRKWFIGLVVFSVIFFLLALSGTISLQASMSPTGAGTAVIWISFVGTFVLSIVSLLEWCKHGAMLPSALVMAYFTYMAWMTVLCEPKDLYNKSELVISGPFTEVGVANAGAVLFGILLLIVTLIVYLRNPDLLSFGTGSESQQSWDNVLESEPSRQKADEENGNGASCDGGEDLPKAAYGGTIWFLFIHVCASLYVNRLLVRQQEPFTFWVYAVAGWIALILFAWHIVAPQFLERDFDHAATV